MKKLLSLFLWFTFLSVNLFGQYYENGQDPFSTHWKMIKTKDFKLIFSEDAQSIAQKYSQYFYTLWDSGGTTLNYRPKKLPIVLHNQNVYSNGEVAWAPKRMNLYAIQPQVGYAEPYEKQLAMHEFRHVVQIDKLNQKSTRVLYYMFGEQAIGAVLGWHIPRWFFEGDAVAFETGASNQGRGRIPDFSMKLKAQIEYQDLFSYPKAQFGSYKHFVPNHYELGYQLISIARMQYGTEIWAKTLDQVAAWPIHPNSFSKGIKQTTGLPERKFYLQTMQQFKISNALNDSAVIRLKGVSDYSNYCAPKKLDHKFIALKTSYNDIPKFVTIDSMGNEKRVFTPGYVFDQTYSLEKSYLVWNEYKPTRWQNANYTRIAVYNLDSHKLNYITKKTRAFASRISPDGTRVLSTEVDQYLNWAVTIRDIHSGEILDSIHFANQVMQPNWSPDRQQFVFMTLSENGKSLGIYDLTKRSINWIIKEQYLDLSYPQLTDSTLIIKGIYNGKSNYLSYNISEQKWYAITDVKYGVEEPFLTPNQLIFANYTPKGFKIEQQQLENQLLIPIEGPEHYETNLSEILAGQEVQLLKDQTDTIFEVKNYSRLLNLFNIHSWAPLGIQFQNMEVGPGATIMSQDELSTSVLTGGYQYNTTDKSHTVFAEYTYKGFYPVITSRFSKSLNQGYVNDHSNNTYFVKWYYNSIYLNTMFPINLTRGKWYRSLQPAIAYEFISNIPVDENPVELSSIKVNSFTYQLYFSNVLGTSYRGLQARWGQVIKGNYAHSPFEPNKMGQLASAETWLYFPGILKSHGLGIYAGYQWRESGEYYYNDRILYPYGYSSIQNTEMVSIQANYKLPLLYPDLNVFEYIYLKRVKSTLFYQQATFKNAPESILNAAGADVTFDMHLFRFVLPFELGLRYSRRLTYNDNYYQFLINISF